MIANVVIEKPLVSPESLLALDQEDWEHIEKEWKANLNIYKIF